MIFHISLRLYLYHNHTNHSLAIISSPADALAFSSVENYVLSLPARFEPSPTLLLPAAVFLTPFLITPGRGNGLEEEEAIMAFEFPKKFLHAAFVKACEQSV